MTNNLELIVYCKLVTETNPENIHVQNGHTPKGPESDSERPRSRGRAAAEPLNTVSAGLL